MIFKVPKALAEQPLLACAKCGNPVPNDMLDDAQHGRLGPCPICGSEKLADNPNCAMTYSKAIDYPGSIGLAFVGELYDYLHATMYTPKINTEKKKKTHPFLELLEAAMER
jgi:DNA-directed RNA polymerase subunit RPC12/RpoP